MPFRIRQQRKSFFKKMTQPVHKNQYQRGQRYKGRTMEDDKPVFTLDEWERRKAGASTRVDNSDVTRDEDLARQLQNQFDLEDERRGRTGRVQPGECHHLYPRCVNDAPEVKLLLQSVR